MNANQTPTWHVDDTLRRLHVCVCARYMGPDGGDFIPPGTVVVCPVHPNVSFTRGPAAPLYS